MLWIGARLGSACAVKTRQGTCGRDCETGVRPSILRQAVEALDCRSSAVGGQVSLRVRGQTAG